ncbi:MAG: ribosome maturation factor RimP [Lachnospiraceae bacterium]|nr:ribosome maturation factor RimP [Lachnospiraceae bacterium]
MGREEIEKRFASLVRPVTDKQGFELIKTEYVCESGNFFLRAYIDKEGGITIDDCVAVSRVVSKLLDKEDFIEESYTMEISSPGFMNDVESPDTEI